MLALCWNHPKWLLCSADREHEYRHRSMPNSCSGITFQYCQDRLRRICAVPSLSVDPHCRCESRYQWHRQNNLEIYQMWWIPTTTTVNKTQIKMIVRNGNKQHGRQLNKKKNKKNRTKTFRWKQKSGVIEIFCAERWTGTPAKLSRPLHNTLNMNEENERIPINERVDSWNIE